MQGKLDRIWHNQRADGSEYWVLSIEGKRYAAWEKEMVEGLKDGDLVEFAFTHSGRYRNVTGIRRLPATTAGGDTAAVPPDLLRLVRMNCLRTAAGLLRNTTVLPEQKLALTLSIAERFEQHVIQPGSVRPNIPGQEPPGTGSDMQPKAGEGSE